MSTLAAVVEHYGTMHLNHKPGEVMQVDWAGDTAAVIDTDTGEIIPAYVFVATLPYSGYSYRGLRGGGRGKGRKLITSCLCGFFGCQA